MDTLPFEIIEQMVQCIGRAFHYKDSVEAFFVSAGIKRTVAIKHKDEYKFVWAKKLLLELSESDEGKVQQRKILQALCDLRKLPDRNVPDPHGGLSALRELKELVNEKSIEIEEKRSETVDRKRLAEEKVKIVQNRAARLTEINDRFRAGFDSKNRQKAGYSLEEILKDLFALAQIEYKKSYKIKTQQIDGHFRFEGFDYLVEAKWSDDQPTEGEIGSFQRKVETKLESTRGVFVSINGVRKEVIEQYSGQGNNIIFITGEDLTHILEGRVELQEVLRIKITMAAQSGLAYVSVQSILDKM